MSDEEVYAEHGRTLAELKSARTKLAAVKAALDRYVKDLEETARLVKQFVADPSASSHLTPWAAKNAARGLATPEAIAGHMDELREQERLVKELEQRASEF